MLHQVLDNVNSRAFYWISGESPNLTLLHTLQNLLQNFPPDPRLEPLYNTPPETTWLTDVGSFSGGRTWLHRGHRIWAFFG